MYLDSLDAPLQDFSCDESESELDTTMETVVMKTFSVYVETQTYFEASIFSDSGIVINQSCASIRSEEKSETVPPLVVDDINSLQRNLAFQHMTSTPKPGHHRKPTTRFGQRFEVYRPSFRKPNTSQEYARRSMEKRLLSSTPQDRSFILSINKLMNDFINGDLKFLRSPQYNSYERMIIHELAKIHGLDHNIEDKAYLGNQKNVIVTKNEDKLPILHYFGVFMIHSGMFTPFCPQILDIINE